MGASLAVALREYNGRAIRWKIRSTIFTKPNGSVIVAAVVFKFHLSLLQKFSLRDCGSAPALRCG